jgi:hypothetical protein
MTTFSQRRCLLRQWQLVTIWLFVKLKGLFCQDVFQNMEAPFFLCREAARVMQCNDGRAAARAFKASDVSESMVTSGSYAG